MTISRTFDVRIIRGIAIHPRIFPWITDDSSAPREKWQPPMNDKLIWLVAGSDIGVLGWGGFFPRTGVTLETHFAFLPEAWGGLARAAFQEMIRWVRLNTNFQRLIGEIPRSNRLAIKFARRAGFKLYAVNKGSIQRKGQLEDQLAFALNL